MLALVACSALLASPGPEAPPPDVSLAYREERARTGRSPEAQVRLALWCEARGLTAERLHHLALAALADPQNATARGLMGLVSHGGRFQRPEAVAEGARENPALAEYDARRQKAPYTADGQWELGAWCDERGLKEQARAHFTAVTRLDPTREHAWRRLGFKRHGSRWLTDAQAVAEKAEAEAQKRADREWRPRLDRYRAMLDQPSKREEAEAALAEVVDPRAVPSILGAFAAGRHPDQARAVQLLGQVESPAASKALASLAVSADSAEARRSAVETLRRRDPRDFVRALIGVVRDPIKYEVKPVGGPGSPGALTIEGQRANLRRTYSPPPVPQVPILPNARVTQDAGGLPVITETVGRAALEARVIWLPITAADEAPLAAALGQAARGGDLAGALAAHPGAAPSTPKVVGYAPYALTADGATPISPDQAALLAGNRRFNQDQDLQIPIGRMRLEAEKSAAAARKQLADDVASIDRVNAEVRRANEPALLALRAVTGREFGDDSRAWGKWWTDQEGYAYHVAQTSDRPTIVEAVPLGYTPVTLPRIVGGAISSSHSCFAAGTVVRTIGGDRAIESIREGDLVLSQDTRAGGLSYRPVVAAFHNPPSATLRVRLAGDEVVATGIHRFWKAGKGWAMARDLEPGDRVRHLGGVARVESVEDERAQPVFNLEVADGHSFLVGKLGVLVHDNSPVEATPSPFDAPAGR